VLCWHRKAHKRRKLDADATSRRGPTAGPSRDYHLKQIRDAAKEIVEQQELPYEVLVAHWRPKRPARKG
jgi:transposase